MSAELPSARPEASAFEPVMASGLQSGLTSHGTFSMTPITDNQWTLHYTIGRELAAMVSSADLVHMPGGGVLIVVGGRAPRRINDLGSVIVRDPRAAGLDESPARPGALGMVWISAAGGWSEVPV